MAAPYRSIREHLDDVLALSLHLLKRRRMGGGPAEDVAELDLRIVDLGELIEDRLELSVLRGFELPLDRVRQAFQLEATEQRCLWLLITMAISGEARAIAGAWSKGHADALSLEVLDDIVYGAAELRDQFAIELGEGGRLLRYGLIEAAEQSAGYSRAVRVSDRIVDLAYGVTVANGEYVRFASVEERRFALLVAAKTEVRLRDVLQRQVEQGMGLVPVLRGAQGSGRRSLAANAAAELEAKALIVRCEDLAQESAFVRAIVAVQREAILQRAVIVFANAERLEDAERLRALDQMFRGYPGPVVVTSTAHGAGGGLFSSRGTIVLDLEPLTEAERAVLWRRHLGEQVEEEVVLDAAARYRLTGGQIERAARACAERSSSLGEVHAGVSAALDDKLSLLGTRIEGRQSWADLVLPEESHGELVEMTARIRYRRQVLDDWGFADKVRKGLGLAVLFSGPPGTGKTMAAGLVAQELGLDLYQIDLSRMVSKYVGETEKNLAQVFDAAESGHAILLFDEADALFSKRTEVKSSVDRYANLEVNYLLQRMEAFSGVTILTTNFDNAIDEAFRRRLSYRIAFALPEREERRRLWRAVIPARALTPGIDFGDLADRFEMSGGYIKNAALRAAYLAAAEGTTIEMHHLLRAAGAEYASMGKVVSERVRRGLG